MFRLCWHIRIGNYSVKTLKELKITTSVLNLSDTAVIAMPGKYINKWKGVEDKIRVGDEVEVKLGYDDVIETEFKGYLKRISRDNNSLTLECEDALYLMRKSVKDKEYKNVTLKSVLADMVRQIDPYITITCDYDYKIAKLIVFHNTAMDVLNKIHEECKANIYFEGKTLHIHPVYSERADEKAALFDTSVNVQANELKWIDKADKKVLVEVSFNKPNGEVEKETYGTEGGEKITKRVSGLDAKSRRAAAENEYNLWNYSGFEGNFTAWLIPRVKAGGSVVLRDQEKTDGKYYVTGVEVEFGQNGAKRKISLGRKLR